MKTKSYGPSKDTLLIVPLFVESPQINVKFLNLKLAKNYIETHNLLNGAKMDSYWNTDYNDDSG